MNIFEHIKSHDPKKVALCDEKQTILYGDLMTEIETRVADIVDVSCLGIALDNNTDWILWDLATLKAGIPCVPLPPFFTAEQTSHAIQSAGISHIISSEGLKNISGGKAQEHLPSSTAKVTFTSGTTGNPKGVCLSYSAMENVASSLIKILGDEFTGTHCCVLPLAVLLENVAGIYTGLMAGCIIELRALQSFGKNYEYLHEYLKDATSVILVPEILRILMAQIAIKGALPNLKFIAVGGSKIAPSLIKKARAMGLPVYEGYGLSECASVVSLNTPNKDKIGSAGQVLPHIRTRIIEGEIHIKNIGFLGYIGEKAPDIFPTGDLGVIDDNGFLSITGRKKNILITSYGRNISPEWVEATLLAQPEIAQAIVYGDAQASLSALIVPTSSKGSIKNAINTANASLPNYAQIRNFQLIPPFTIEAGTLTGTGRPRREQILNYYIKENEDELL